MANMQQRSSIDSSEAKGKYLMCRYFFEISLTFNVDHFGMSQLFEELVNHR